MYIDLCYILCDRMYVQFHAGWDECACCDFGVMSMNFLAGVQLDRVVYFYSITPACGSKPTG